MIRRKRKRIFNQPQPQNFLRNRYNGYPAQYGNPNIGRSNGDDYKRALNYYRPVGAGPNQYGPNRPGRNYPGGLRSGNFKGQPGFPPQGNPEPYYSAGFNSRSGNYFPMRMPQGNAGQNIQSFNGAGFLQKKAGVIRNVPANLKQSNFHSYQPEPANNFLRLGQRNPEFEGPRNYPGSKANAANLKKNIAYNLVNDLKHQIAYENGKNQDEAVNEDELIREFQALLDKNMVPNMNGRTVTIVNNPNAAGNYGVNTKPYSSFGQQFQQRHSYYTALRQQPPQNQIPPQNLNLPNLANQQPFFQNPANQNQYYLLQQSQNQPQNQNPYQQNQEINSQNQGFHRQYTNFYQQAVQQYPQFQSHPSNNMQKSLELIQQNPNLFPPIVEGQGQKLVPPYTESESQALIPPDAPKKYDPGPAYVDPRVDNPVPPNTVTQDQSQFSSNADPHNQNQFPQNTETQDQDQFSPTTGSQDQNQFPFPEILDHNPSSPNANTQAQNVFPNIQSQDQNPAPKNLEPQNQSPTPQFLQPQVQSPTPQFFEPQVQNASPNTEEQRVTPTTQKPVQPINQNTNTNNNSIQNHATEAIDLDYGAIPGWLDQDFMPQIASTEPEPEITERTF